MVRGTPNEKSVFAKSQDAARVGKKKINKRTSLVKTANSQDDPLASLPLFKTYAENGIEIKLSTKRVTDLDDFMKKTMMFLVETNMKRHFMKSKMGWDEKKISSEMFREPTAWYLIAEESEGGNFVGFSHFRFDMDCSCDEVLYVYDLQIESAFQGKGLGNFIMTSLETIACKAEMRKIMLTVFKHNPNATKFFKQYMKFAIDETSPRGAPPSDFYILSKQNNEKQGEESLETKTQNMSLGKTKVKGYTAGGKAVKGGEECLDGG